MDKTEYRDITIKDVLRVANLVNTVELRNGETLNLTKESLSKVLSAVFGDGEEVVRVELS